MGLAPAAIAYLMIEGKRREFSGSVLTLGVQNVFMTQDQFEKLAHSLSYNLNPAPTKLTKLPLIEGQITCEYALLRLGFSDVVATDANDFEDADFLFDLNDEKVPDVHRGVYDLVIDSGTLEHVFHLPNALRNVVNFASDGGRVIHLSPSSNHIDHGFYMFSPTLFWDFYSVNEQEIIAPRVSYPSASGIGGSSDRLGSPNYTPGNALNWSESSIRDSTWSTFSRVTSKI